MNKWFLKSFYCLICALFIITTELCDELQSPRCTFAILIATTKLLV